MKITISVISTLLLIITGCGHTLERDYVESDSAISNIKTVAVMPFENLTKFPNAGEIVAELFTTELYQSTDLKILGRNQAKRVMREKKITPPQVIDRRFAQKIGQVLEVDGVFIGSVSEYWYRLEKKKRRQAGEEPAVGINARLIDVASGNVIWASSHSRS
ncbi:MAG TPA: penicillin-binding protein activator LpoB, partial [Proteobacteria bacterium]|nr:penicillin-binding protein activator LpoB [Pseudomonadota bacterium]